VISFRYHLVSIVAVFLALALGIVIGTAALNGPITTDLRNQVNTLKNDRTNLAQQVKTLQGQLADAGAFADTFGTSIVANTLSKQNVLLLTMPGASSTTRDGVVREITAAGGKITGNVALTASYIDQRRSSDIVQLVTTDHPIGLTLPQTNDPGQLAGGLLAYVLLGKGQPTDLSQVVSAFAQLHMLSVEENSITPSTSIVVVGTGAMPNGDYGAKVELSLVSALAAGGHVVVAGNAAGATQAGLVAEVRASSKSSVSTVDNADTSIGQVSTVLALANIINSNVGHYGTAKNADSLFPTPASK
jgi:hypothetical protein